jgi:hypothetical protein
MSEAKINGSASERAKWWNESFGEEHRLLTQVLAVAQEREQVSAYAVADNFGVFKKQIAERLLLLEQVLVMTRAVEVALTGRIRGDETDLAVNLLNHMEAKVRSAGAAHIEALREELLQAKAELQQVRRERDHTKERCRQELEQARKLHTLLTPKE